MTLKEIKDFKGYLGAHYTAYTMKEFFSEANAKDIPKLQGDTAV